MKVLVLVAVIVILLSIVTKIVFTGEAAGTRAGAETDTYNEIDILDDPMFDEGVYVLTDKDFDHFLVAIRGVLSDNEVEKMNQFRYNFVGMKLSPLDIVLETVSAIYEMNKDFLDTNDFSDENRRYVNRMMMYQSYGRVWSHLPRDILDGLHKVLQEIKGTEGTEDMIHMNELTSF